MTETLARFSQHETVRRMKTETYKLNLIYRCRRGSTRGRITPPHSSTFKEDAHPPLITLDLGQGNQPHQEERGAQETLSDRANSAPTPIIIDSRVDSRVTDGEGGENPKSQERGTTPPPNKR